MKILRERRVGDGDEQVRITIFEDWSVTITGQKGGIHLTWEQANEAQGAISGWWGESGSRVSASGKVTRYFYSADVK